MDKFYTKPSVIPPLLEAIDFGRFDCVIEPSAGSGSFSRLLEKLHPNVHSYDIAPDGPNIIQRDFLKATFPIFEQYERILVVGNPPFGRQSSLAIKFFNRAASFSSVICIAMILPKSFRKTSIQNRCSLDFCLDTEMDIPNDAFFEGKRKSVNVPCIFQIWNRTSKRRTKTQPLTLNCQEMKFVKKEDNDPPDLAIRRVGFYAGRCEPYDNQSHQSFLFLRVAGIDTKAVMDYLNRIEWSHENTVGPRSISKQEFIRVLNAFRSDS